MRFKNTYLNFFAVFFWTVLGCFSCGERNNAVDKIRIATASNMQFAAEELAKEFENRTGIPCELILGSSGKLTAQIIQGAPFDILLSADMKYPNKIFQEGLTLQPPEVYAYGKLVLWSFEERADLSMKSLGDKDIEHIAIGNPKTAPYGIAAREALTYYFEQKLEEKLIYGENVSQINQFVTSQSVQVGLTSKSVVLSSEMKGKGSWVEVDEASYTPIEQGFVLLKGDEQKNTDVHKFREFIFSERGREILVNNGYSINE